MRPNTSLDDLYASRLLQELETQATTPRPDLGLLILGLYGLFLGLFLYWIVA